MRPVKPLTVKGRAAWRAWLQKNHDKTEGVWLAVAKKHAAGLHYGEAVEEALCFGWIDSTVRALDQDFFSQWFSPRKPGSGWSNSNKDRIERLITTGRMTPAGLKAINAAKASGSWEKLTGVESLQVPEDLERELKRNPIAHENFHGLALSLRKQYIYWVEEAKRPETRKKRISETVKMVAAGKKSRSE